MNFVIIKKLLFRLYFNFWGMSKIIPYLFGFLFILRFGDEKLHSWYLLSMQTDNIS